MTYRVEIRKRDGILTAAAREGENLLHVLRKSGISVDTPCGGKGTCGKCGVRVSGIAGRPSANETALLSRAQLDKGYRLACGCAITADTVVYMDDSENEAAIITAGIRRDIGICPLVKKRYIELIPPGLEDQTPDMERLLAASGMTAGSDMLPLLRRLPSVLRASDYKVTVVEAGGKLISAEPGDTTNCLYGAAFDIGTTTVAAYLYDLRNGELRAVGSMLNPQRKYGADIISRINHARQSDECLLEMRELITSCINELLQKLAGDAGISCDDIYHTVFSGNTTMLHFLNGLDASALAVSPFIPVTCGLLHLAARECGIAVNSRGLVTHIPCVSAYIGADTVAAVLSSGMYEQDGVSLLIDIGTNGEIVLGGSGWLMACSTAAGPAFEGAGLRWGMGGVTGAISSFAAGPDYGYTVIGNKAPRGICGSGIIDAVAVLLDEGIIDETGRLAGNSDEEGLPAEARRHLVNIGDMRSFVIAEEDESGTGEPVVITQKDIREIQNAKAAIAAGIDTLLHISGIGYDQVNKVFLAGGFGSSIRISSAARIGLLPQCLTGRVETIGNASGSGAAECLLSDSMLKTSESIAKRIEYIELSASAYFTEKYVDNMMFYGA
jgi:uncharacterized 2Fe-2S/4Fe-4S cluster protein (DUF4445 family)